MLRLRKKEKKKKSCAQKEKEKPGSVETKSDMKQNLKVQWT